MSGFKEGFKIESSSFPKEFDSNVDTDNKEYGLKIAHAIQQEWFNRDSTSCRYVNNWIEFNNRRLYASANQPTQKYKDLISVNGDMSLMNLDFQPLAIGPKFELLIVNGMVDREFSIKATSQDPISTAKKQKYVKEVEADIYAKDFLHTTQEQFGVDAFNVDPNELPETSEEFEVYKQMNEKLGIELANELAIDTVLKVNNYKEVERRVLTDLVGTGLGVVKHEFHIYNGIQVNYVDSANFIYSQTEDPYFRDCFYYGEVKIVHKSELFKINPDITPEKAAELCGISYMINDYYPILRQYNLFNQESVGLLFFNYKTTRPTVYKVKKTKDGGKRVIKKDVNFNPGENDLFERKIVQREVWYEGVLVLGTNELLKWEVNPNMVKTDSARQELQPNYIVCAPELSQGVVNSTMNKMIPHIDQMQLDHLMLQKVKSRIVPDGVFIDIDGIMEVDLGGGNVQQPIDALNMYYQNGSVIGRSKTQDGEYNNAKIPIQELNTSSAQTKISALIGSYNNGMAMIRDLIGINEARDATTPDPRALVGVQKMAALNSNTATRHILDGMVSITERLAYCVSLRISDQLKYSDTKDELISQIGAQNVAILEDISNLYLHSFGITIELEPDQEEQNELNNHIQIALKNGEILLEDVSELRNIKNTKLAFNVLKYRQKRRKEERERREDLQAQMTQAFQIEIQNKTAETAQIKAQAEAQAKIMVEQAKTEGAIALLNAEVQSKSILMDREFQYNMQLQGREAEKVAEKVKVIEDRKDKRQDRGNTQMSKMIEQRHKDLPSMDFESSNDTIGDFDLEAFEPR